MEIGNWKIRSRPLLLSAFCFLPSAFCLLLSAFCLLPSARALAYGPVVLLIDLAKGAGVVTVGLVGDAG